MIDEAHERWLLTNILFGLAKVPLPFRLLLFSARIMFNERFVHRALCRAHSESRDMPQRRSLERTSLWLVIASRQSGNS